MSKISNLPYAQWLEGSLENIIKSNTKSICILTKNDKGEIGSGYFDCSVADKLLFVGFLQQDAMIETLIVNGYLEDDEEEEDPDTDDAEDYCE